jgi:hypothetical protein
MVLHQQHQLHLLPQPFLHCAYLCLNGADALAAGVKILGLLLIDNTQSQFPVALSSPSSLSSKAPIIDHAPVNINLATWIIFSCRLPAQVLWANTRQQCKLIHND